VIEHIIVATKVSNRRWLPGEPGIKLLMKIKDDLVARLEQAQKEAKQP
jgi:hypothetical protein